MNTGYDPLLFIDEEYSIEFKKVDKWLKESIPLDQYVYAKACSLTDTGVTYRLGRYMWELALKGRIYLVRRKISDTRPSIYEYIAIRASKPPVKSLLPLPMYFTAQGKDNSKPKSEPVGKRWNKVVLTPKEQSETPNNE